MTTISSLPDEVLSHCFTFCEWNDIICIELVCHRWKFIIRDDKEWMRRLCIPSTSAYPPTQLEDPESLALFVFSSSSPASLQSQPNLNGSCGQGEEVEGEEEMDQPLQSPTRSAPRLRIPKPSSSAADYLSDDIAFETLKAANKVPPALSLRERVGEGYANVLYPTLSLMPASLSDWIKEDEAKRLFFELGVAAARPPMEILAEGVAESSADQPSQTIYQTLNHSRNDFWSSKGSASNQTHESLIYRLLDHACIVKQVIIQPFKAFFQHGLPCYAPQYVTVSVGFRQDQYHFTSPPFPVVNTPTEQTIDLAPLMIVGGFLKMDLYGRNTTQPGDNLYYTVLDRVKCLGLPITTFFNNSENISNALPTLASSLLKLGDVLNADYPTHYFKFPMKEYLEVSGDSSDKKREEILHTALVKSFHSDYFYENYNPDNYSRPICKLKKVLKRCLGRQEWPEIMRLISLESQKSPFRQAEFLEPLFERYNCNLASRNEPCNAMGIHSLNLYLNRGDADNQAVNDGLPFFLNNSEAMLFARTVLRDHKRIPESLAMFTGAMESRWFDCTEAIGEVFRSEVRDLVLDSLCLEIYGLANCFDKLVEYLLLLKHYESALSMMLTTFNSEAAAATSLVLRAHGKPDAAVFAMAAIGFEGRCRDDVLRVLGLDRELRLVSDLVELRYELEKWGGDGK